MKRVQEVPDVVHPSLTSRGPGRGARKLVRELPTYFGANVGSFDPGERE
jgi:hypothetical protein